MIRSKHSRSLILTCAALFFAAAPLTASAAPTDSLSAQKFVTKASSVDRLEVELGQLALKKSKNSDVKQFAQTMIHDHGQFQKKVASTAKSENLDVPKSLPSNMQQKYDQMAKMSGKSFDTAYAKFNVKGHKEAVALFKKEKASDNNKEVSQLAASGLPVIEGHLRKAKQMAKTVGANAS